MGAPADHPVAPDVEQSTAPGQPPAPGEAGPFDVEPATGVEMRGDSYRYSSPEGWVDITKQVAQSENTVDTAAGQSLKDVDTVRENLNTVTVPAPLLTIDDYEAIAAVKLAFMVKDLDVYAQTEIAGRPAAHVGGPANTGGTTFFFEQYAVLEDGELHTISFATELDRPEAERRDLIDSVLASWQWSA